jgi:uncharacterized membrane protein
VTRVIAVLAVVGLGIAGYLTYVHYAGVHVLCAASGGCETVQTSSYSKLAGVPVPVLGLIGYAGILVSLFVPGDSGRLATAGLALVGFGFSVYLTYLEVFVIKAICQWCVGSAALLTAIAVLAVIRLLRAPVVPARAGPT